MALEPRISIVTLGVDDIAESTAFYRRLGFEPAAPSNENVTFMQLRGGMILGLYGRAALAADADVPAGERAVFPGVSLAYNVRAESDVAATLDAAIAAGARLVKPAEKVFWGGTSGYFADPDGFLWEVAHNPFFPLDAEGGISLPSDNEET